MKGFFWGIKKWWKQRGKSGKRGIGLNIKAVRVMMENGKGEF